jgi:hypothetical protein
VAPPSLGQSTQRKPSLVTLAPRASVSATRSAAWMVLSVRALRRMLLLDISGLRKCC